MKPFNQKPNQSPSISTEQTAIGEQFLIGEIKPVSQREKLELMATLPMQPRRACPQKQCDIGLFDEAARNQLALF